MDVRDRVDRAAARWSLTLGEPFPYSYASLALPAVLPDGTQAVLKVQFPHRESDHEADALRLWDGDGAIRLIAADPVDHALLLERCVPGTALADSPGIDIVGVVIGLLPRLWVPASAPFTTLADEAAHWADYLQDKWVAAGRPFERRLLDAALDAIRTLPSGQGPQVLLNQDLHAGNVLASAREPWLVIDPKPLVGERECGIAPVVRDAAPGEVRHRFDRLTAELGLDRDRARGWTIGQTIAWCFDGGGVLAGHLEVARRLLPGSGIR